MFITQSSFYRLPRVYPRLPVAMSMSRLHRRTNRTDIQDESEQIQDDSRDSCPLLGEDETSSTYIEPQRIRDVRRVDNGVLSPSLSLAQRIRSRKNRFIQRVLVACHVAEPSHDLTFRQAQQSMKTAIDQLSVIRNGIFAHSQTIVNLSMAICRFTGNSASFHDDSQDALANVAVEGSRIREYSLVFSDQVEKAILMRIDHHIIEFERIQSLLDERAKLVLDVEYAKRTLMLEQQKGNVNRIAERKQALQRAQLTCENATRFITNQLKLVQPKQDADLLAFFQEYAQLVAQFFKRGCELVGTDSKSA